MLKRVIRHISTLMRAWRMKRKPVAVLLRPFRVDISKKVAFLRKAEQTRVLILGSSHAYNGWIAEDGEFNFGLRNCDLYHAAQLFLQIVERGLAKTIKTVVLFYDVFSPGFVMELTSRGSLAVPYRYLWNIPYQAPLRIDHRVIDRRLCESFAEEESLVVSNDYLGNALYEVGKKAPPAVGPRVFAHLRHNSRPNDQTKHLQKMCEVCCSHGIRIVIVLPPVRQDYYLLLPKPHEQLFSRLRAFCDPRNIEIVDLTNSDLFGSEDFLDSDHLSRVGAERLTKLLRMRLQMMAE